MADHGYTEHIIEAIVASLDKNHDGLVTWHDFRHGWQKGQLRRRMLELHPELRSKSKLAPTPGEGGIESLSLAGNQMGEHKEGYMPLRIALVGVVVKNRCYVGFGVSVRHGHVHRHHHHR